MLEFSPLGKNPHRNEDAVRQVLRDALYTSLDFRVTASLPGSGYKLQEGSFLLGVTHATYMPGMKRLTWGMWTIVLTSITGYAQAYPGYDFLFEIRLVEVEEITDYVIGAGFAITRG